MQAFEIAGSNRGSYGAPFDDNVLNYHHFMALFKEVVESKVEDPRGRLTRLLKYTRGSQRTHRLLHPIPIQ